ncbi:competence protein ComK [Aquibacillus rhizosphaerae]|uniref:Competence protein ComK n=1 Tax=Aquibacillus rhizosphaerae TaxID=3051431 RepID=A0ABT7L9C8_9BACI|nr:competence protein ComK [Aquibacillus sp. LR5S19]MDL4842469.1 competence protein ComK [Aquibacillus sp. LR5S19]
MKEIFNDYAITEHTMILSPAAHVDYQTIVLEHNRKLFVKKTPIQLIKKACLEGGSSYDGRRSAMIYLTSCRRKVPIPIDPNKDIFAFPTHSPSQYSCEWIFYNHIRLIRSSINSMSNNPVCMITFKNGQQLTTESSYYTIEKQMYRTAMCMLRLSIHSYNVYA